MFVLVNVRACEIRLFVVLFVSLCVKLWARVCVVTVIVVVYVYFCECVDM